MTWSINLNGHDDLPEDKKVLFETGLVDEVKRFVAEMQEIEGCNVTSGYVTTNTTGQVDVVNVS